MMAGEAAKQYVVIWDLNALVTVWRAQDLNNLSDSSQLLNSPNYLPAPDGDGHLVQTARLFRILHRLSQRVGSVRVNHRLQLTNLQDGEKGVLALCSALETILGEDCPDSFKQASVKEELQQFLEAKADVIAEELQAFDTKVAELSSGSTKGLIGIIKRLKNPESHRGETKSDGFNDKAVYLEIAKLVGITIPAGSQNVLSNQEYNDFSGKFSRKINDRSLSPENVVQFCKDLKEENVRHALLKEKTIQFDIDFYSSSKSDVSQSTKVFITDASNKKLVEEAGYVYIDKAGFGCVTDGVGYQEVAPIPVYLDLMCSHLGLGICNLFGYAFKIMDEDAAIKSNIKHPLGIAYQLVSSDNACELLKEFFNKHSSTKPVQNWLERMVEDVFASISGDITVHQQPSKDMQLFIEICRAISGDLEGQAVSFVSEACFSDGLLTALQSAVGKENKTFSVLAETQPYLNKTVARLVLLWIAQNFVYFEDVYREDGCKKRLPYLQSWAKFLVQVALDPAGQSYTSALIERCYAQWQRVVDVIAGEFNLLAENKRQKCCAKPNFGSLKHEETGVDTVQYKETRRVNSDIDVVDYLRARFRVNGQYPNSLHYFLKINLENKGNQWYILSYIVAKNDQNTADSPLVIEENNISDWAVTLNRHDDNGGLCHHFTAAYTYILKATLSDLKNDTSGQYRELTLEYDVRPDEFYVGHNPRHFLKTYMPGDYDLQHDLILGKTNVQLHNALKQATTNDNLREVDRILALELLIWFRKHRLIEKARKADAAMLAPQSRRQPNNHASDEGATLTVVVQEAQHPALALLSKIAAYYQPANSNQMRFNANNKGIPQWKKDAVDLSLNALILCVIGGMYNNSSNFPYQSADVLAIGDESVTKIIRLSVIALAVISMGYFGTENFFRRVFYPVADYLALKYREYKEGGRLTTDLRQAVLEAAVVNGGVLAKQTNALLKNSKKYPPGLSENVRRSLVEIAAYAGEMQQFVQIIHAVQPISPPLTLLCDPERSNENYLGAQAAVRIAIEEAAKRGLAIQREATFSITNFLFIALFIASLVVTFKIFNEKLEGLETEEFWGDFMTNVIIWTVRAAAAGTAVVVANAIDDTIKCGVHLYGYFRKEKNNSTADRNDGAINSPNYNIQ